MRWSPSFECHVDPDGDRRYVVGHELVDEFLEFVAARSRANTVRAYAHDLCVFFSVVGKDPDAVTTKDVLSFVTAQRRGRPGAESDRPALQGACFILLTRGREDWTMTEGSKPIEVSRRIAAPAAIIFEILVNPQRHVDFDGSGMLRGAVLDRPISGVGDTFIMKMHRLGDDYLMINHVVEFQPDQRIFWEPAPGDPSRAEDHDPSKVGIPAGYRWGYILIPDGDHAAVVTEVFDCGPLPEDLLRDGGAWINGTNSVVESMAASLEKLEKISTR